MTELEKEILIMLQNTNKQIIDLLCFDEEKCFMPDHYKGFPLLQSDCKCADGSECRQMSVCTRTVQCRNIVNHIDTLLER